MPDDLKYWVALSTNLNIGAKTFQKIYSRFSTMEEAWEASNNRFIEEGISPKIIGFINQVRENINPDKEMEKLDRLKIKAVSIKDQSYPKILKELPDAPALLYIKGEFKPEDELSVAVVGSRKFTSYGARVVEKIVMPLAESGVTIVSGLALGIDSIAHKVTVDAHGRTIAVLGNGLDHIYPETNRGLANSIIDSGGAIISEFPVGTPSFKYNFPFRNRIIAGLSLGTLVVEAATESGSLITASCALDYNKQVFAVPGSIFSDVSEGPNNLIKMGAKTVTTYEDIVSDLNLDIKSKHNQAKQIIPDTKEEALILSALEKDTIHIDKIVEMTKLDIIKVNQTLLLMEMKGKVKNLGGNQYIINK